MLNGRYAGKKAVVVKTFDETGERKFGHAIGASCAHLAFVRSTHACCARRRVMLPGGTRGRFAVPSPLCLLLLYCHCSRALTCAGCLLLRAVPRDFCSGWHRPQPAPRVQEDDQVAHREAQQGQALREVRQLQPRDAHPVRAAVPAAAAVAPCARLTVGGTRSYQLDMDLKKLVDEKTLKNADARKQARKQLRKLFEERCVRRACRAPRVSAAVTLTSPPVAPTGAPPASSPGT